MNVLLISAGKIILSKMKFLFLLILCGSFSKTYGQTENDWEKRTAYLGGKRERAISFTIADSGYVGMGEDTVEMTHNDLWKYDPGTAQWTQKASLPGSTRRNAMALSINGKGYVGMGADSSESSTGTILWDWWEYDAMSNSWTQKADYPGGYNDQNTFLGPGVYFGTAFEINSKGYICGGKMGPNQYASDLWEYDPITDTWTRKADFPGLDRHQLSSFALEGKGYVGMGIDHDLYRKDWWRYDPLTDSWTEAASLPGVERGAASTFVLGQRGFLVFGSDGGYKDELWEYNPFTDSWMIRANFPGGERKNAVAFAIGDSAYAGMGKGATGKRRNFYRYYPLLPVGISQPEFSFNVFPNPTTEYLQIVSELKGFYVFQLVDFQGRVIAQTSLNTIDLTTIEKGTYILNIFDENSGHLMTKKIVVQ